VDGRAVAEIALVFRERGRIEEAQTLLGPSKLLLDEIVGIGTHQPLGKIVWLDHEKPMPGESAPLPRHVVEQMMLRNDVENGGAGPLPPRTVTMRAPLVLTSVRMNPSNIAPLCALGRTPWLVRQHDEFREAAGLPTGRAS